MEKVKRITPSRTKTRTGIALAYISALSLIAGLTVASHFVVADTLRKNEGSAAVVNLSGRQRMLSQRIVALALEVRRGDESARAPLRTAISEFSTAHRRLVALSQTAPADSPLAKRLQTDYYGPPKTDAHLHRFLHAAQDIANAPASPAEVARFAKQGYPDDIATLADLSRGPLLQGLEQIVAAHQADSEDRIIRLERIQLGILGTVLLLLLIEALFIFRPMAKKICAYVQQLKQLADNDYLTGIPNRRAFVNRALNEVERSRRHGLDLSLLLIDVDHFKQVNDVHGHPAGDAVLVALARTLDQAARQEDMAGRLGGEEFALLLPATSLPQASLVAERLRQAVARTTVDVNGKEIAVTISIGVASVPLEEVAPFKAAMQTADAMLYRAKAAGRNCVRPNLTEVPLAKAS